MSAIPKRPRIVDRHAGLDKCRREQVCRVCRRGPVTRHHLIGRGVYGSDVDMNIVPLCGTGTTGCHGIVTAGQTAECADGQRRTPAEVRSRIRATLRPEELSFLIAQRSLDWLNRTYPLPADQGGTK